MNDTLRISAKALGELAMPNFDPQVFWVKSRARFKTPFNIFPGIFSTLDKHQKSITIKSKELTGSWPTWIGDVKEYVSCPHWSTFNFTDEETGIIVSGAMDECFRLQDDSLLISDNKLAMHTGRQDDLMPMYEVQLNAYADICERTDLGVASRLQLVYHEPMVEFASDDVFKKLFFSDRYMLRFKPKVVEIKRDRSLVPGLLKKAKGIISLAKPPSPLNERISNDLEIVLAMAKAYNDGMAIPPAPKPETLMKIKAQVNGVEVTTLEVPVGSSAGDVEKAAAEDLFVLKAIGSGSISKCIYVPTTSINIVVGHDVVEVSESLLF
jgi:hypothetical protein